MLKSCNLHQYLFIRFPLITKDTELEINPYVKYTLSKHNVLASSSPINLFETQ
jgi:hypothetical protein